MTHYPEVANRLAIDGGKPIRKDPLSPWPMYEQDEIAAVTKILKFGNVNYWTGDECRQFEREFADYHGVEYACALANGTLALELALKVIGIGSGDEVVVTPRSYFASASCIVLSGARPIFAEVDQNTQNSTVESIEAVLTPRTKGIMVVHLAGWPCAMPLIMDLARSRDLQVIEDCAQAHGARINGQVVGSFGAISAFSFCQDKIMSTAGEGGMLLTNDKALWSAAWSFKDHGKSWDCVYAKDHPPGFRWLHQGIGSNWRMTEIQGAIGRIQLSKLDNWVARRRENAARLAAGIKDIQALRVPLPSEAEHHAYYKFYAFVRPERLRPEWTRDRILVALEAEGIPGLSGSCPEIYREEAFSSKDYPTLPVARSLGETSLMLPVHPTLAESEIDDMVAALQKVMACAAA